MRPAVALIIQLRGRELEADSCPVKMLNEWHMSHDAASFGIAGLCSSLAFYQEHVDPSFGRATRKSLEAIFSVIFPDML